MPIINEKEINFHTVKEVAKFMAVSARTAPKAKGNDNLEIIIAEDDTINLLSEKMTKMATDLGMSFFERDAANILKSPAILLIGTRIKAQGLTKCGMCGFANCAEKEKNPGVPCIFNTHDLGIAIGSACSVAASHHIDNRVMFTLGQAAMELGLFSAGITVAFGIPLSATGKNPFFDRSTT